MPLPVTLWRTPSPEDTRRLRNRDVHLWRIELAETSVERYSTILSGEELERSGRFRLERDRRRYLSSRAALRTILAGYLGTAPRGLRLAAGGSGKPYLAGPGGRFLRFNLTHSSEIAVLAVCRRRALGVDIERIRSIPDLETILSRFSGQQEAEAILSLPPSERSAAFLALWCRMEAAVKARGGRLLEEIGKARIVKKNAGLCYRLVDFPPAPGYCGTLCFRGKPRRLYFWQY